MRTKKNENLYFKKIIGRVFKNKYWKWIHIFQIWRFKVHIMLKRMVGNKIVESQLAIWLPTTKI
jgi:hypothetical protein